MEVQKTGSLASVSLKMPNHSQGNEVTHKGLY